MFTEIYNFCYINSQYIITLAIRLVQRLAIMIPCAVYVLLQCKVVEFTSILQFNE